MSEITLQDTKNELHRLKKHYTGTQGCSVKHEQANQYVADCISIALVALQEKQDRDADCEYCTEVDETNKAGKKFFKASQDEYGTGHGTGCLAYSEKDGWTFHWEDDEGGMYDTPTCVCLRCGRKLKGSGEHEKD